jgi:hypothetical protein
MSDVLINVHFDSNSVFSRAPGRRRDCMIAYLTFADSSGRSLIISGECTVLKR